MPQTVEEVEEWDEDYNFYCCKKPLMLPWRRLDDQRDVSQTKEQAEETWDEDHIFNCCTKSLFHAWIRLGEQIDLPETEELEQAWVWSEV